MIVGSVVRKSSFIRHGFTRQARNSREALGNMMDSALEIQKPHDRMAAYLADDMDRGERFDPRPHGIANTPPAFPK